MWHWSICIPSHLGQVNKSWAGNVADTLPTCSIWHPGICLVRCSTWRPLDWHYISPRCHSSFLNLEYLEYLLMDFKLIFSTGPSICPTITHLKPPRTCSKTLQYVAGPKKRSNTERHRHAFTCFHQVCILFILVVLLFSHGGMIHDKHI